MNPEELSISKIPLPTRIAILGTGVIGSGWAAPFLRNGMTKTTYDLK